MPSSTIPVFGLDYDNCALDFVKGDIEKALFVEPRPWLKQTQMYQIFETRANHFHVMIQLNCEYDSDYAFTTMYELFNVFNGMDRKYATCVSMAQMHSLAIRPKKLLLENGSTWQKHNFLKLHEYLCRV